MFIHFRPPPQLTDKLWANHFFLTNNGCRKKNTKYTAFYSCTKKEGCEEINNVDDKYAKSSYVREYSAYIIGRIDYIPSTSFLE